VAASQLKIALCSPAYPHVWTHTHKHTHTHRSHRATVVYPIICTTAGLFAGVFGVGGGIVKVSGRRIKCKGREEGTKVGRGVCVSAGGRRARVCTDEASGAKLESLSHRIRTRFYTTHAHTRTHAYRLL
jgi:hypothetical protein